MKKLFPPHFIYVLFLFLFPVVQAQVRTVSSDTGWNRQQVVLNNTKEADVIIRIGDVDNLGFGWPEGFDPFCGHMTDSHPYPWDAHQEDLPGFDRILLSSKFNPEGEFPCGGDGYSASYNRSLSKPVTYSLPVKTLKGASIKNAFLQIFIDDFQAPSLCSKFQLFINETRFAEGEKIMNAIDQTGPVGKLVTIPLPEEFYNSMTTSDILQFKIDESTGSADGFAIDFIRLLVNRNRDNTCKGDITGKVVEKDTDTPVPNAKVWLADNTGTTADENGIFMFRGIPTGYEIISASAAGYADGYAAADIGPGEINPEVTIYLVKGKQVVRFDDKQISVGESISLDNIMFDQGKADLRNESKAGLDKVAAFLLSNPQAEIELSGHTSNEGPAILNRSLSYKRVKACKDYILKQGVDSGRIIAKGYGPDRPVAPNDTEENRMKNRRVEMRLVKL